MFGEEGLNEPAEAVQVLQIVVAAGRTSAALYAALAEYAYKAHNTRVGDLASAKAVSLAPAAQRTRLKTELAEIKKNPTGKRCQASTGAAASTCSSASSVRRTASKRHRHDGGKTYHTPRARPAHRHVRRPRNSEHSRGWLGEHSRRPAARPRLARPALYRAPADRLRRPAGDRRGGVGLPVRAGREHRLLPPVLLRPDRRQVLPAHRVLPARALDRRSRVRRTRSCRAERLQTAFDREVAERFEMDWEMRWWGERQRIAILVSRHDHCLLDLLWRWRRGELDAEIVAGDLQPSRPEQRDGRGRRPLPPRAGRDGAASRRPRRRCSSCWRARPSCSCSRATCRSSAATSCSAWACPRSTSTTRSCPRSPAPTPTGARTSAGSS